MRRLMPLRRAVVELTNEALKNDDQSIRKAMKSWHNRLSNGSLPRSLITKVGGQLFLNLDAWEEWLTEKTLPVASNGRGRPRSEG